ncbi:MAG: hypothetical protein ACT4N7_20440 [Actinokineospora sp.]
MSGGRCCPQCGLPTGEPPGDFTGDTVESLSREVRVLRETIARLRGAGAGRSDTGPHARVHPAASG